MIKADTCDSVSECILCAANMLDRLESAGLEEHNYPYCYIKHAEIEVEHALVLLGKR